MKKIQKFLGSWILQPEKCDYEAGVPPKSGKYSIIQQDDSLQFNMVWTSQEGKKFKVEYSEQPDGEEHPYDNKQIADSIRLIVKDETIMESEAFIDGQMTMRATRELLDDNTLQVTFEGILPEGQSYYNISLYKRSD